VRALARVRVCGGGGVLARVRVCMCVGGGALARMRVCMCVGGEVLARVCVGGVATAGEACKLRMVFLPARAMAW